MLCSLLLCPSALYAAGQTPPDELTLNVGDIDKDGRDKIVVLKKRSVRSDTYLVGTWSQADGFKKLEPFPVRTYRGYVKDKPAMQVNADIEPGGRLYANFSVGRGHVATIDNRVISLPAGGKCTPVMSAGNKVVPVKASRVSSTPGGYLVPEQPMRRIEVCLDISAALVN